MDSKVVLTKMKLFRNFHERLLIADDSVSTISAVSIFEQDISNPTKGFESQLDDKFEQPRLESGSDCQSAVFSDSQLPRLYKFESEDSGVELPSGANSPSTPTGSEQSFVVHSRESSCDSCNLNSDSTAPTDKLDTYAENSEIKHAEDLVDKSLSITVSTQDSVFMHSEELSSLAVKGEPHKDEDMDKHQSMTSEIRPEGDEQSGQLMENSSATERTCFMHTRQYGKQSSTGACDDMLGNDFKPEPMWRSATTDSLEEYMNECCRLSEVST